MMNTHNVIHNRATILSRFLQLGTSDDQNWGPEELSAALKNHLATPLVFDSNNQIIENRKLPTIGQIKEQTVNDLFDSQNPSLQWLIHIKDCAKSNCNHFDEVIPKRVASVIYYASIIAAKIHHHQTITSLDLKAIRSGIKWGLNQSWLVESMKDYFQQGLLTFE